MLREHYHKTIVAILTLAILIAISYSNTINVPFQFDDFPNIVDNQFIKISSFQFNELSQAATNGRSLHRWLPNLTFASQYYFSGLDTPAYHYFNITLHFFCAVILYFLLLTTLDYAGAAADKIRKYEIALVATILWSLHPVQTNAVTYIVQRMASMATLFYLSAILLYARGRLPNQPAIHKYLLFFAAGICGLLAIASKENAAMLPMMIIAYELFIISPDTSLLHRRRTFFAIGCAFLLLLALGWLWIGRNIIDQILQGYQGRYFTLTERLMTEPRVFFYYLGLLIYPALSQLNIDHDIVISTSPLSPPTTIMAIGGLLLVLYSVRYLFNKNRILSFAILWFLLNLAIESSILPLELYFEHRLYLPSTFLIFALVLVIYRSASQHITQLRIGIGIITICLGVLTWNRNLVWQSEISLWSDAATKSPHLARPFINLGDDLKNARRFSEAETYLLKAIEIDKERTIDRNHPAWRNEMSDVHADLALVYSGLNNLPQALAYAEEALRLDPTYDYAILTYATLLVKKGQYTTADAIFTKVAASGVDTADLYKNWGVCAEASGNIDRAIQYFSHALSLDPRDLESHYNLGLVYGEKGMLDDARREMSLGMQR